MRPQICCCCFVAKIDIALNQPYKGHKSCLDLYLSRPFGLCMAVVNQWSSELKAVDANLWICVNVCLFSAKAWRYRKHFRVSVIWPALLKAQLLRERYAWWYNCGTYCNWQTNAGLIFLSHKQVLSHVYTVMFIIILYAACVWLWHSLTKDMLALVL